MHGCKVGLCYVNLHLQVVDAVLINLLNSTELFHGNNLQYFSVLKDFPVAYGCANGYVRLLRPAGGLVKTLGAHGDKASVTNVAIGSGGVNIVVVSAAIDGTIKVRPNVVNG